MTDNFYNTIGETGDELKTSNNKARQQEHLVMKVFNRHEAVGGSHLTPWEVLSLWPTSYSTAPPITSVRRAMTNLTTKGVLEKVPHMVRERYGKRNHVWRRVPVDQTQGDLFKEVT